FGGQGMTHLADTSLWNGSGWIEPDGGSAPPARDRCAMATFNPDPLLLDAGNRSLVILNGGDRDSGQPNQSDQWSRDGSTWCQSREAGAPGPRAYHAMVPLGPELVMFGGANGATTYGDTWTFNGTAWTLSAASGPPPRVSHAMASLNGRVVLFGGTGANGELG